MEETEHHKKKTNLIFDLFFKKSISPKIFHNNKARYFSRFSVRTSGTPSPCCRGGRPAWSWASGRCSGSGRRGYTSPRPPCTPRWWRSPGRSQWHDDLQYNIYGTWLAWHSMHRSMMWLRQMAQFSTWMSHDHSALACHRFTSNLAQVCSWGGAGCSCCSWWHSSIPHTLNKLWYFAMLLYLLSAWICSFFAVSNWVIGYFGSSLLL